MDPNASESSVINVTTRTIACDGGYTGAQRDLGHPKVYLRMPASDNQVVCTYCNRRFVLK